MAVRSGGVNDRIACIANPAHMKIRSSAVVLLFALVFGESIGAQNDTVSITSVQAWVQKWSPVSKSWYVGGWRDGWIKAEAFIKYGLAYGLGERLKNDRAAKSIVDSMLLDRNDSPVMDTRHYCWTAMSPGQLMAIIDKAAKDHPEKWDEEIDQFVFHALLEACDARTK
jgi:hypothetical protein